MLIERDGKIEPTGVAFESEQALMHVIERVLSPLAAGLTRRVRWSMHASAMVRESTA